MTKFLNFFKSIPRPITFSVCSGILIGTSYIPFPGWALLFCYAPLWLAVGAELNTGATSDYKKIFFLGWISQFILTLIGFNWIYYVSSEFGLLHWSISALALILFAALMHLYIPLSLLIGSFLISRFKIKSNLVQFVLLALSLSFLERIWPSIFEWNLGYSLLWMKWPLFQWADTVGFWGLSTWILIIQALFTYCLLIRKTQKKKALEIFAITFSMIIILTGLGMMKEKRWSHFDQSVKFALVQGNVGNSEKIQAEKKRNFQIFILNIYANLSAEHLKQNPETEIMLWPETAMPFALDTAFLGRTEQSELLARVAGWKIPLITGGYSIDTNQKDHFGNEMISNSVFFLGGPTNKLMADSYNKTDLLVFGEYMPFGRQLPFLYKLLPFVGNFKIGPGASVRELQLANKTIKVGPQICYESLNPGFSRGLANKGAQILFNVTNDSWFGWWAEPYQHQIMTLGRAVEVRRPLVRSTNTGISSVMLANGEQLENSPIGKTWAHTYEVKYQEHPSQSVYTRFGHFDWILWLAVFIALIYFNRKKEQNVQH